MDFLREEKKVRVQFIDNARAIGMILVVLGHSIQIVRDNCGSNSSMDFLLKFIYTFHMPLFWFISGILFSEKNMNMSFFQFLLSRIRKYIVPYLFLDISGGLILMLMNNSISVKEAIINTLTLHDNVGPNWFLPALFIGEVLMYLYEKTYHPIYKWFVWIPFFLVPVFYPIETYSYLILIRGIICFTFILIGKAYKKEFLSDNLKLAIVIAATLGITINVACLNGQIDIWACHIGSALLCVIGAISGTIFIFGISKYLKFKLLPFLGKNTIIVLGTHSILLAYVYYWLKATLFSSLSIGIVNKTIILFLIVIVIEYPIIFVYKRLFGIILGCKTK